VLAGPPPSVILHKFNEWYIAAPDDPAAQQAVERLLSLSAIWIDPPKQVAGLLNRTKLFHALQLIGNHHGFTVPHTQTTSWAQLPDGFPCIVKHAEAGASTNAHLMAVVPGRRAWEQITAHPLFSSWHQVIVQPLIPHGGILCKVYAIAPRGKDPVVHYSLRPSLKDEWNAGNVAYSRWLL
jgi:hypothetical protein